MSDNTTPAPKRRWVRWTVGSICSLLVVGMFGGISLIASQPQLDPAVQATVSIELDALGYGLAGSNSSYVVKKAHDDGNGDRAEAIIKMGTCEAFLVIAEPRHGAWRWFLNGGTLLPRFSELKTLPSMKDCATSSLVPTS